MASAEHDKQVSEDVLVNNSLLPSVLLSQLPLEVLQSCFVSEVPRELALRQKFGPPLALKGYFCLLNAGMDFFDRSTVKAGASPLKWLSLSHTIFSAVDFGAKYDSFDIVVY